MCAHAYARESDFHKSSEFVFYSQSLPCSKTSEISPKTSEIFQKTSEIFQIFSDVFQKTSEFFFIFSNSLTPRFL